MISDTRALSNIQLLQKQYISVHFWLTPHCILLSDKISDIFNTLCSHLCKPQPQWWMLNSHFGNQNWALLSLQKQKYCYWSFWLSLLYTVLRRWTIVASPFDSKITARDHCWRAMTRVTHAIYFVVVILYVGAHLKSCGWVRDGARATAQIWMKYTMWPHEGAATKGPTNRLSFCLCQHYRHFLLINPFSILLIPFLAVDSWSLSQKGRFTAERQFLYWQTRWLCLYLFF